MPNNIESSVRVDRFNKEEFIERLNYRLNHDEEFKESMVKKYGEKILHL